MKEQNKSPRRIFLQKLTAGSVSLALAGGFSEKLFAWNNTSETLNLLTGNNDFVSDKKFVPVMLTPYKQNGQIDFDGLSKLTDFYLAAGAKGLFANCLSSEMYSLKPEERLAVTRHVAKRVNGAVSVVATGSFGDTLNDKAAFTKQIYHTGINAVILITGHFAKQEENDEALIANFEKFFNLTDNIPTGTYECPSPYKRVLTPAVFKYLLGTNRLVYHKDTTIDFAKVKAKIDLVKNNRLEFYDACIANATNSMQAGAKGMSAICGNFYPEIISWICANVTNPSRQEDVKFIQEQLTKTEDIISANYSLSAKYFLQKRGVPIEISSRTSSSALTAAQKQTLDGVYKTFLGWCDRIGIKPATI
jgi:4-hydroxy-tetrahydrodipicolinate synthase